MWYFSTLVDVLILKTYYNILIRFVKVAFWFILKGNSQNTSRVKFKQVHLEEISWSTSQEKKIKWGEAPISPFSVSHLDWTILQIIHLNPFWQFVLEFYRLTFFPSFIQLPLFFYSLDRELNTSLFCQHFKPVLACSRDHSHTHVKVVIVELETIFNF